MPDAAAPPPPERPGPQRGVSLLWALVASALIGGIVLASTDEIRALDRLTESDFSMHAQARGMAGAGLVDAFAWFRRQAAQPVTEFAPRRDLEADPPVNETEDPAVGLVREFEISPGIWGRYEVRRGSPGEPFTDEDADGAYDVGEPFLDTDGNGRWSPPWGTRDVSALRDVSRAGTAWHVESVGEVYLRLRADLPLGVGANRRVGTASLSTEIRRLTLVPPADAPVCAPRGDLIVVKGRTRIRAQMVGVVYAEATGVPEVSNGAVIDGGTAAVPDYPGSIRDVFGVDWTQLKSMADLSTSDADTLPGRMPEHGLVVVEDDVEFDRKRPLRGTGVVVVKGDVLIHGGSNSYFNGVLYVDGNLRCRPPFYFRGTIITTQGARFDGGGGDHVEVQYDAEIVDQLRRKMGRYRYAMATYKPSLRLADGRPVDALSPEVRGTALGEASAGGGPAE